MTPLPCVQDFHAYLVRPLFHLVEEHQDTHLVRGHLDDVLPRTVLGGTGSTGISVIFLGTEKRGVEIGGAQLGLQRQLAPTVLGEVKPGKGENIYIYISAFICLSAFICSSETHDGIPI